MSEQPQSDRLEAVITLSRSAVRDTVAALQKRIAVMVEARERCALGPNRSRQKLLRAAHCELTEFQAELSWHYNQKQPYRYVVPLTPEEGRALNEELNGGHGSTHP